MATSTLFETKLGAADARVTSGHGSSLTPRHHDSSMSMSSLAPHQFALLVWLCFNIDTTYDDDDDIADGAIEIRC